MDIISGVNFELLQFVGLSLLCEYAHSIRSFHLYKKHDIKLYHFKFFSLIVCSGGIDQMKIALFGAHGRVGQAFLRFVKEDDRYMVRSLIRTNREEMLAGMFQVTGNSRNQEDVLETIKGSDIVVSCLSTDGDDTLSVSMEHIVQAMKQTGTSRIITIGTRDFESKAAA